MNGRGAGLFTSRRFGRALAWPGGALGSVAYIGVIYI